jgi:hypothetical protein
MDQKATISGWILGIECLKKRAANNACVLNLCKDTPVF